MAKTQAKIHIGRRKEAVARVILTPVSSGSAMEITVNNKPIETFFANPIHQEDVVRPLKTTGQYGSYHVRANVAGGGTSGQAGSVRLGISRALVDINEEFKTLLRKDDLVTRDPRMVERKKYGRPKARKRFQFSKR
jgi:small subunit ribosomal protein S9